MKRQLGTDVFPSHGYNQFFPDGRWVTVTPAFDKDLCRQIGVPIVELDGVHDSTLPPVDLTGSPYIDYMEIFGQEDDLPFDWIKEKVSRVWGQKHSWLFGKDSEGHVIPLSGFRF